MTCSTLKRMSMYLGLMALLVTGLNLPVFAQEEKEDDKKPEVFEQVVVTGSRARPRSVAESMVPIDVITVEDFVSQGSTDISDKLRNVVPSFNVNVQPISDAATVVRPANLRGLAPDHTLVLINGKRRHRAAVIYWLGNGVSDGAQGPDISGIPSIALRSVEVLRDGASAQYGSDAIAGVMNFMLSESREGGSIEVSQGSFFEGDGDTTTISANVGLPLGDNGFANLSAEIGSADPTDRSVQRDDAAALIAAGNTFVRDPAQVWGSPEVEDEIKLWGNFGWDLESGARMYAHTNYVSKTVTGGFYFRNPNTRSAVFSGDGGQTLLVGDLLDAQDGILDGSADCPTVNIVNNVPDQEALAAVFANPNCFSFQEMFPGGFTPSFGGDVIDLAITGGVKGQADSGLFWDVSVSYGSNEVDFFINNTVNASLGPNSPTSFDPGLYKQTDFNVNFDVAYPVGDNANLGAGFEYRDEEFEIGIGQLESYQIGPLAEQGFSAASNGFPGFGELAAGSWSRANVALYADLEVDLSDNLDVGVAARYEDFDDFGTTMNSKFAFNWSATEKFSWRGSLSSGFRAPTPGQSNAFNVSTEFDLVAMELVNNGTIPSSSRVAELRGGKPLLPERSVNLSTGAVMKLGALDITADYFSIELKDRLAVTQLFELTADEVEALLAEGVTSAANLQNFRFFTNDFETETSGFDIVATVSPDKLGGNTTLNMIYNYTKTEVTKFNPDTLDATRIRELEEGLPATRWNINVTHMINSFRLMGRVSYFDDWYDSEDDLDYSGKSLVDLEASYVWNEKLQFVLGAQNAFDTFPDENPGARAGVGNLYSQFTPFGFNGGFMYGRIKYNF